MIGWPHIDQEDRLRQWMNTRRITAVHVVSPHLDDAVFSLAEFLGRSGFPPRMVLTVFTQAGDGEHYAQATGFVDAEEEFRVRRQEDVNAMERLGLPFVHCGGQQGRRDRETTDLALRPVLDVDDTNRLLVLLPLGAGRGLSPLHRVVRRALRLPVGCESHSEHIWVRDQFRSRTGTGATLGYYAEVPYQWANSAGELLRLARELSGNGVEGFSLRPDAHAKLAASRAYASQIVAEFGARPGYQLRTAGIPERIFLPA